VRFVYNESNPRQLIAGKEQVGFVAQEVRKVFPEAVSEAEDGYLDFNIHSINVALINAVQELKTENDRLKTENEKVNSRLEKLERLFSISEKQNK
jgi:trimeric autotransporter adhesin